MPAVQCSSTGRSSDVISNDPRTSADNEPSSSKWDNIPGLFSNEDAFAERSYWDRRFMDERAFEWYRSYSSLRPILLRHLPPDSRILHLGFGTSTIQVDMVHKDGYHCIMNIDFSLVAVQKATDRDAAIPALSYDVADARSMPQFADASFQGVLDKGLLDAILCGDNAEGEAAQVLREVWRLLGPGAAYVMVTSGSPRSRLPYLQQPSTPWSSLQVYEVGQQHVVEGPYDIGHGEAAMELPRLPYSHMVYVCTK